MAEKKLWILRPERECVESPQKETLKRLLKACNPWMWDIKRYCIQVKQVPKIMLLGRFQLDIKQVQPPNNRNSRFVIVLQVHTVLKLWLKKEPFYCSKKIGTVGKRDFRTEVWLRENNTLRWKESAMLSMIWAAREWYRRITISLGTSEFHIQRQEHK